MKKSLNQTLSLVLVLCLCLTMLPVVTMQVEAASNIVINGIDIGYANESYFTKNGSTCKDYNNYHSNGTAKATCHNRSGYDCTKTTDPSCNCMRYWPTGSSSTCQVDLKASQCFGYARYCQWKVYGTYDVNSPSSFTDITGDIYSASCTGSYLKQKLINCAPATHLRTFSSVKGWGHSICIINATDYGVNFTDCNSDGCCIVRYKTMSWDELATFVKGYGGIDYTNSYKNPVPPHTTHTYTGSYYEAAHPHKEYQKCSCGATRYTGGTKTVSSCTTCNPTPTPTAPIVYMDYPQGSYSLNNNIEVKGWIAGNEPISWVMCDIDDYGQITLGMWDSPDEAAQYPQYTYFKRFNGVIEASKLTAGRTYGYHIFSSVSNGAYMYNGSFSTIDTAPPPPIKDWKIHLDTPTGIHDRYDHIELKGWLVCNQKPAYIMAELKGKRQWDMAFYESAETMAGYTYFMRFSTVIDVNLLEPNTNYTIVVWSSLSDATTFTFATGPHVIPEYYSVTYHANGGTNAPTAQSKKQLAELKLTTAVPNKVGYTFKGWALSSSATTADYQPGDPFTTDADTILYAVWEPGCGGTHSYSYSVAQEPSVDYAGALKGTCAACGATTSVILPSLDDGSYTYTVQTVPECEKQGVGQYTWNVAQYGVYDFTVTLPALGHSYQDTVIAPDCINKGYTSHHCSVCGKSYQSDEAEPLGHDYQYEVTQEPTKNVQGALSGSCLRCAETLQLALPPLDAVSYTYAVIQEATETQTGIGQYTWNNQSYGIYQFVETIPKREPSDTPVEQDPNIPRIMVESKKASRGQRITLQMTIEKNPGFSALQAAIRYDTQYLTLVSAENQISSMYMTPGASYVWDGAQNYTEDGCILTLTFEIDEEAPEGDYELQTIFVSASNDSFEEVEMLGVSGVLSVTAAVYGDTNGDGKITTVDLAMLRQYLSGMDPITGESTVNVEAGADANGDGKITAIDLAMLRKYLAGMDPITGESSVVLGPK